MTLTMKMCLWWILLTFLSLSSAHPISSRPHHVRTVDKLTQNRLLSANQQKLDNALANIRKTPPAIYNRLYFLLRLKNSLSKDGVGVKRLREKRISLLDRLVLSHVNVASKLTSTSNVRQMLLLFYKRLHSVEQKSQNTRRKPQSSPDELTTFVSPTQQPVTVKSNGNKSSNNLLDNDQGDYPWSIKGAKQKICRSKAPQKSEDKNKRTIKVSKTKRFIEEAQWLDYASGDVSNNEGMRQQSTEIPAFTDDSAWGFESADTSEYPEIQSHHVDQSPITRSDATREEPLTEAYDYWLDESKYEYPGLELSDLAVIEDKSDHFPPIQGAFDENGFGDFVDAAQMVPIDADDTSDGGQWAQRPFSSDELGEVEYLPMHQSWPEDDLQWMGEITPEHSEDSWIQEQLPIESWDVIGSNYWDDVDKGNKQPDTEDWLMNVMTGKIPRNKADEMRTQFSVPPPTVTVQTASNGQDQHFSMLPDTVTSPDVEQKDSTDELFKSVKQRTDSKSDFWSHMFITKPTSQEIIETKPLEQALENVNVEYDENC